MIHAIAAEWTKLWSVRSTWYCLLAGAALAAVQAASLTASFLNGEAHEIVAAGVLPLTTTAKVSLQVAQVGVITLAMLSATSEYSTRTILTSLQCVPVRARFVAAKLAVVVPSSAVAGCAFAATGMLTASLLAEGRVALDPDAALRTLTQLGAYTGLVGAITLGVGLLIRSAAGTLTAMFLLLLILPGVLSETSIPAVTWVAAHLPGAAGFALLNGDAPLGDSVEAFAILAGWAVGAGGLSSARLRLRDA